MKNCQHTLISYGLQTRKSPLSTSEIYNFTLPCRSSIPIKHWKEISDDTTESVLRFSIYWSFVHVGGIRPQLPERHEEWDAKCWKLNLCIVPLGNSRKRMVWVYAQDRQSIYLIKNIHLTGTELFEFESKVADIVRSLGALCRAIITKP